MMFKWINRILLILLIIGIGALAIAAVVRADRENREIDSYCAYLDAKYNWKW